MMHNKKKLSIPPVTLALNGKKSYGWDFWEPAIKVGIFLIGLILLYYAFQQKLLFHNGFLFMSEMDTLFARYLMMASSFIFIGTLVFRTFLWFRYHEYNPAEVSVHEWPDVLVIIPAYNEENNIYKTICSVAASDYPAGLLHIIAVDDGSQDETYKQMCRAQQDYPQLVELLRFEHNRGKREGIHEAFKLRSSTYFITLDSDTVLEKNAIRSLLVPLIKNPRIGAVTGRIRIWNQNANLFTKMLGTNFAMAFDFTRAIQSTFSSVFCTSGAFSAYRSALIPLFLEQWLQQTFLKSRCTYGEDRSLANFILRTGHGIVFQRTAVAYTLVPERFLKILKMLTRWARSNIRETIVFSAIVFNSKRKGNYLLPFIEFFTSTSLLILHFIWFYYFLFAGAMGGEYFLRLFSYTIFFGFVYILYYARIEGAKDMPYLLVFSLFSSLFMVWIFTVAGVTIRQRSWSTR